MKQILLVGLGGFIGTIGRYKLGELILHHTENWRFPLGTFTVNIVGCLVIGALSGLIEKHGFLPPEVRGFLLPGLIGGFTTFSAFANEGVSLMRRGELHVALSYTVLSVVCGLFAVWLGMKLIGGESNA